jgi:hypothetical protein
MYFLYRKITSAKQLEYITKWDNNETIIQQEALKIVNGVGSDLSNDKAFVRILKYFFYFRLLNKSHTSKDH